MYALPETNRFRAASIFITYVLQYHALTSVIYLPPIPLLQDGAPIQSSVLFLTLKEDNAQSLDIFIEGFES